MAEMTMFLTFLLPALIVPGGKRADWGALATGTGRIFGGDPEPKALSHLALHGRQCPHGLDQAGAVAVVEARTELSVFNFGDPIPGKRTAAVCLGLRMITLAWALKNGINDGVFNKNVGIA